MIKENDFFTKRNDHSQIIEYNNPQFECFSSSAYFSANQHYFVPDHWHEDLEYLYVVEGELEYHVNGQNIIIHAGEGILVNSKRIHSNRSLPGKSCAFYCAIVHPCLLCSNRYIQQTYLFPVISPNSFDYLLLSSGDWTKQIIDELVRMFESPDIKNIELEILESFIRMFKILYAHLEKAVLPSPVSAARIGTFKSMLLYIQEHYHEKVSLEEIADVGSVGKTLCTKLFRTYTSKTPGEYLIHYRIQKSLDLLTYTRDSITDIAYAVGFSSASHYTRTFRDIWGVPRLNTALIPLKILQVIILSAVITFKKHLRKKRNPFLPEVLRIMLLFIWMHLHYFTTFTTCSAPAYRVTVTSAFPERPITVSLPSVFTSPADTEAAATFTRRTA